MTKKVKKTAAQLEAQSKRRNKILLLEQKLRLSKEREEIMLELMGLELELAKFTKFANAANKSFKEKTLSAEEQVLLNTKMDELKQIKIIKTNIQKLETQKKKEICELIAGRKIKNLEK